IKEELNVKAVTLHQGAGATGGSFARATLLSLEVKANLKTLGPRAGPKLQQVKKHLESAPSEVMSLLEGKSSAVTITLDGQPIVITVADLTSTPKAPEGWAGVIEKGTQVAIDTRLTKELKQSGQAREIVRYVQQLRKDSDLEMEDRIALHLATESADLREAIAANME